MMSANFSLSPYLEKIFSNQHALCENDPCFFFPFKFLSDNLLFSTFSATSYHVSVKTGDVQGAGTDANVYLILFGENGDTGKLQLRQANNTKNKWERGRSDMFILEAMDIGKV